MKQVRNGSVVRKKSELIPRLLLCGGIAVIVAGAAAVFYNLLWKKLPKTATTSTLEALWREYDYSGVYEASRQILETNPFHNTALTYCGYACFYLAVSQLENAPAQNFLDEAINCMRVALYSARRSLVPQLEYMLGKAYFYKNTVSSYYYADLAVKYLSAARRDGYEAADIPEYLGLSYAALGMTMESIAAFTEALLVRESDSLLLSIAEQYYKTGQTAAAKQYLFQVAGRCTDDDILLKSRNLLGAIYTDEQDYEAARGEFETILKKNQNYADAYYGLGVIYEKQGDLVKARAEWRKALRIQPNHPDAFKKISESK